MGAFTPLKIIITEEAIGNVLQSFLRRYGEGDPAPRPRCCRWGRTGDATAAGEGRGRQPLLGGREQYATKKVPGRCAAARPCAPRESRGGLLVPAFDRIASAGGDFSLVFQRLQPPFPKYRPPLLALFPTRENPHGTKRKPQPAPKLGRIFGVSRWGTVRPARPPAPFPPQPLGGTVPSLSPGAAAPARPPPRGAARSRAGTAPGPPCAAPGSFPLRSCCGAAGTGRGLAGRCQLPSSSYQPRGFVCPSGLGEVLL